MYRPLTESAAMDYVRSAGLDIFRPDETLESEDLADGNVNLVYRVYSPSEPRQRSVIVKQALPYARVVGESFPMPLDRSRIEHRALEIQASYCPSLVPAVYRYDPDLSLVVMEDLHPRIIMRKGLMAQVRYPRFAADAAEFMANMLFHTSDLFLGSAEKKALVREFTNPGMCKVTEDLVFTHPFMEHPGNRWNPELDEEVRQLRADEQLQAEIAQLKTIFMTSAQALLHGDLHTGSIMVTPDDTKVIDPEFAFFGPMGFDVGALLGNLALSCASQEHHAVTAAARREYRAWITGTMREVWQLFEARFRSLFEASAPAQWPRGRFLDAYMRRLLQDAAGFGGTKMLRRILGLAHVVDLDAISDVHERAAAERIALAIGRTWILRRRDMQSIDDLIGIVEAAVVGPVAG